LFAADQPLGPSESTTEFQHLALPTLLPGTTYYWMIVSKTAALKTKTGAVWSFTTEGGVPPPPPPAPGAKTVVIWASKSTFHGHWQKLADTTAAGGSALWNPNAGQAKIVPALAAPANYFEASFSATSGTAYHLWVRMRAEGNSLGNDSVHVQFSDSVDAGGASTMRTGTSSAAAVVLQAGDADSADHNWGWADNGWNSPGPHIYFAATGTHTLRVQQREDGAIIDQIVLSPDTYLNAPPGPRDNDTFILPASNAISGGEAGTVSWLNPAGDAMPISPSRDGGVLADRMTAFAAYARARHRTAREALIAT